MKYDLIVIGGGPAGYTAAIRAAKLDKRVALVEERDLGGTCLNRGCIPTKVLLRSAELFSSRSEWAELGIRADNISLDQEKLFLRKDSIVGKLRTGIESLIAAGKIQLYRSHGKIIGKNEVQLTHTSEVIAADYILIATGSRPAGFDASRPIKGIDSALNSDDVLNAPITGDSVIIIGAGVIGVELASYFAGIGKQVTLVAPSERIIKMMSKELSVQLAAVLKKSGTKIITNAKIDSVTPNTVVLNVGDGQETLSASAVIAALGRTPNTEDIGLENVGLDAKKFIKTDQNMNTGMETIYAAGDVTGGIMLAHYAAASGIRAVESMFGLKHSMDLSVVPSCIYTTPEIATVGKKEDEVEGAKVGKFLMAANGKSAIDGINRGYIKVIANALDKVVGAEVFASRGTDIIGELALAISAGLSTHEVSSVIHAHPTIYEAIAEAVEDIEGLSTHLMPKK